MPTLEELLADAKIADDMEVVLGDYKFKVGEVRRFRTEAEKKFAEKVAETVAERERLTQLATEATQLIEKMNAEPPVPKTKGNGAEGEIDFDTDALYSPVAKKLKPILEGLETLKKQNETLTTSLLESSKVFLHDFYARNWNALPAEKRGNKTWKDYLKKAVELKINNEYNLPDPVGALMREIEPIERDAMAKENETLKAQVAELQKQSAMPRMPRPGATGAPSAPKGKEKAFESADELVDAAFADPAIQEIIGAGGRPV